MPSAEDIAYRHYRDRARLADAMAKEAARLWGRVDPANIKDSWRAQAARLLVGLSGAQMAAAEAADGYAEAVLDAQEFDVPAEGRVVARSLAGVASDGRSLVTLLEQPAIGAVQALAAGQPIGRAMATGAASLDMIVRTQVADTGRVADGMTVTARPETGYVRVVVGATCSRCLILAGRRYEWNAGFKRHPRCDCIHVPTAELGPGVAPPSPRKLFDEMSHAEQDKTFTRAGAQAIRDGADMGQVVNARRGMQTASVGGRDVRVTTEGTTARGVAGRQMGARGAGTRQAGERYSRAARPRLMPEAVYAVAKDRDDAVRLLKANGYLADPRRGVPKVSIPAVKVAPTLAQRVAGGVADRRRLGGMSATTERVTLSDGSTAIYKKARADLGELPVDQQDAEELGALVAKAVGLRAPDVYRASESEIYMSLMPGRTADELAAGVVAGLRASDEGARLGLADLLMGNFDRNGGNLIVDGQRIAAIDHGAAFQWHDRLNNPGRPPQTNPDWFHRFVDASGDKWAANPLSAADVGVLRDRLSGLRPQFARLGRTAWYDGMVGRLNVLARHASGKGLL